MGIFDRKTEKRKSKEMTEAQKIRQRYAIINYYKKKIVIKINDTVLFPAYNQTNIKRGRKNGRK